VRGSWQAPLLYRSAIERFRFSCLSRPPFFYFFNPPKGPSSFLCVEKAAGLFPSFSSGSRRNGPHFFLLFFFRAFVPAWSMRYRSCPPFSLLYRISWSGVAQNFLPKASLFFQATKVPGTLPKKTTRSPHPSLLSINDTPFFSLSPMTLPFSLPHGRPFAGGGS